MLLRVQLIILLLTIEIGSGTELLAQLTTIERIQESALKYQQSNYLKISLGNISCDSVILKSTALVDRKDSCYWIVRPLNYERPPGLKIEILKIVNADTIHVENRYYRIERLNPLVAEIGHYSDGDTITMVELLMQSGINLFERYGQYNCFNARPKNYKCMILRDLNTISLLENEGSDFTPDVAKSFRSLIPGDRIIFFDIKYVANLEEKYNPIRLLELIVR